MRYCFIKHGDVHKEWPAWKAGRRGDFADSVVPIVQDIERVVGTDPALVLSMGFEDAELIDGNFHFVTLKRDGRTPYPLDMLAMWWRVWKWLNIHKPDVTVVLTSDLLISVADRYHKRHGGRVLPTLMGLPMVPNARWDKRLMSTQLFKTLSRDRVPVVLSIGRAPARQIAEHVGEEKEVWEFWPEFPQDDVNHRQPIDLDDDGRFRVMFVGRAVEQKGVYDLVEMAAALTDDIPNLEVIVIGDGPAREEAERRTRERGLEGVMTFLGHKPARSLFSYLEAGDVLVIPTHATFSETTCRACIEGMLAGIVPVGATVGGIVDNIDDGETGFLVPPGDNDLFADRILTLYRDPELRRTMNENAKIKRDFFLNPPDTLPQAISRFVADRLQPGGLST